MPLYFIKILLYSGAGVGIIFLKRGSSYQLIKSGSKTPGSSYQVIKSRKNCLVQVIKLSNPVQKRPVQVIKLSNPVKHARFKLSFFTKINLIQDQVIKLFDLGFNLGSSYHLILVQVIKLSKVISHSIF